MDVIRQLSNIFTFPCSIAVIAKVSEGLPISNMLSLVMFEMYYANEKPVCGYMLCKKGHCFKQPDTKI